MNDRIYLSNKDVVRKFILGYSCLLREEASTFDLILMKMSFLFLKGIQIYSKKVLSANFSLF